MTKQVLSIAIAAALLLPMFSCNNQQSAGETVVSDSAVVSVDKEDILENTVLSQEQQKALSPQAVLDLLMQGNKDFVEDNLTIRNSSARIRAAAASQFPKAVVLSCLDSRVPVEDVFHRGIGDVFVGRVAGNISNEDLLGSMEFGCKVSGAKLILVLGHEHCGAIKSAIDDVKLGNITALLAKIRPAVISTTYTGEKTSKNDAFVHAVCEQNVRLTVSTIRKNSPMLAEMEKNNELLIRGAVYDMNTGVVSLLAD